MKNLLILLFPFMLFGCGSAENPASERSTYYMAAPDLLYFKNIRQTNYKQLEAARDGIDLYEPRSWSSISTGPDWKPQIAINWLEDEAYFFLQLEEFDGEYAEPFTWYWSDGVGQDSMVVNRFDLENQYAIAVLLKDKLAKGYDLFLLDGEGKQQPFLVDGDVRTAMSVALRDYFRLLGE